MLAQLMIGKRLTKSFVALVILLACNAKALAELDKESQEALDKTQQLLRDPVQRAKAVKESPDAQSNDAELSKLLGSQSGGAYDLSADIFAQIVKDSNGDVAVMQQKIEQAQKNPEAFLKSLTPEQQARIKAMAKQAEGNRKPTGKP